jgi:dolichol-phosphate mannosyltransferase
VYAVRRDRKENWLLVTLYHFFYRILTHLSSVSMPLDAGDFCLLSREVVNAINRLPEKERFVRGLRAWVGYNQVPLEYGRDTRHGGQSKYSLLGLTRLAITGIVSFSDRPLLYVTIAGLVISGVALLYGAFLLVLAIGFRHLVTGYASLMSAVLFLGGMQLVAIGLVGIYVGRIFREVKGRPTYVVRSLRGLEEQS